MNPKQLESKVRQIVAEAEKRGIWDATLNLITKLRDLFGSESAKSEFSCATVTYGLRIFTGTEYIRLQQVTNTGNKHFLQVEISRSNGEVLFKASLEKECHARRDASWNTDPDRLRHIRLDATRCVVLEVYRPGQWERILQFDEALRLLNEERDARNSLATRKGIAFSNVQRKLALDFGIKV